MTVAIARMKSHGKHYKAMIDLKQAICDIKADQLNCVHFESLQWQQFYQGNNGLFEKVQHAKPTRAASQHLLGLLTKAHIESLSQIEAHRSSVAAMNQAFEQQLGKEHAANFHYQDGEQFILVTHLWLYLQGYLNMDFSLANDHAEQTATTLVSLEGGDIQALRAEFMASFYQGKNLNKTTPSAHGFIHWLKSLFQ